jgi:hypothetical protein
MTDEFKTIPLYHAPKIHFLISLISALSSINFPLKNLCNKNNTPQSLHFPHPHLPLFSLDNLLQRLTSQSKTFLFISFFFSPVLQVIFLGIFLA